MGKRSVEDARARELVLDGLRELSGRAEHAWLARLQLDDGVAAIAAPAGREGRLGQGRLRQLEVSVRFGDQPGWNPGEAGALASALAKWIALRLGHAVRVSIDGPGAHAEEYALPNEAWFGFSGGGPEIARGAAKEAK